MTTSDKVVLIVGMANCITMAGTGWMGLKAFEAMFARKEPKLTPEEKKHNASNRVPSRKRRIALLFLFILSLFTIFLSWHQHRDGPLNIFSVLQICVSFLGIAFSIVGYFIDSILLMFKEHLSISRNHEEDLQDHLKLMKMMASEIDKKADSRRKIQPPAN